MSHATDHSSSTCPGCAEGSLVAMGQGIRAELCSSCKGVLVAPDALPDVAGARVPLAPAAISLDAPEPPRCPRDGGALLERWAFGREDLSVLCCASCSASFLPPGSLPRLRAEVDARAAKAPRHPRTAPARPMGDEAPAEEDAEERRIDRLSFDRPIVDLVALPVAFVFALLLTSTTFGRLLVFPVQLVFHELGHAIPSWLSSRAALPLPCGITFTREEPTFFTGASFVFLLGVLAYAGHREKRPYAVAVAGALFVAWAFFTLALGADRTREIVLLGGIAGELVLSAFVIASFYFRAPDRLRWDFFRIVALPIATLSFVGTTRLWIEIARGRSEMPMGSLFGSHGDGSGDLDRLLAGYHWTEGGLVGFYLALAAIAGLAVFTLYAVFGLRALRRMR